MAAKNKKPSKSGLITPRLAFIQSLKNLGVASYQEQKDGTWAVAFVNYEGQAAEDEEQETAPVVGFTSASPASDAAAEARRAALQAASLTGIDPSVVATVEAAAVQFEFETGLVSERIQQLRQRLGNAKTEQERLHYAAQLENAEREDIAYAHN